MELDYYVKKETGKLVSVVLFNASNVSTLLENDYIGNVRLDRHGRVFAGVEHDGTIIPYNSFLIIKNNKISEVITENDLRNGYEKWEKSKFAFDIRGNLPQFLSGEMVNFIPIDEICEVIQQKMTNNVWGNVLIKSGPITYEAAPFQLIKTTKV